MSNTPKALPTSPAAGLGVLAPPSGDFGLGLCYQCVKVLGEIALGGRKERPFAPQFAITTAPYPMPELGAVLALPVCWLCLTGRGPAGTPGPVSRLAVPR